MWKRACSLALTLKPFFSVVKVSSNFRSGLRWPRGSLPTRRTETVICDWPAWMAMVLRVVKEGGGSRVSPPSACSVASVVIVTGELLLLLFSSVKRWQSARKDKNTAAVKCLHHIQAKRQNLRKPEEDWGSCRPDWTQTDPVKLQSGWRFLPAAQLGHVVALQSHETPEPKVKIEERVSGREASAPQNQPPEQIYLPATSQKTQKRLWKMSHRCDCRALRTLPQVKRLKKTPKMFKKLYWSDKKIKQSAEKAEIRKLKNRQQIKTLGIASSWFSTWPLTSAGMWRGHHRQVGLALYRP